MPRPSPRQKPSPSPVTTTAAAVVGVGWDRVSHPPQVVAWVRVSRDGDSWDARVAIGHDLALTSLSSIGGPLVVQTARATVERYLLNHRPEVEKLLRQSPG